MSWTNVFPVLCLLSLSPILPIASAVTIDRPLAGIHAGLGCQDCHQDGRPEGSTPSAAATRAEGCTDCHAGYDVIFDRAMTIRAAEKQFVDQSFSDFDPAFFENNCSDCHVSDCLDCHGGDGHNIRSALQSDCLACHRDGYVGREYLGMAPREDQPRYRRGPEFMGEPFLKMRPDLHAEIGLECMDCHSMQSLLAGEKAAKNCRDCHQPDPQVIEHGIAGHMQGMECYACHSAWAPQEYGTFFLRVGENADAKRKFWIKPQGESDYLVSAYLRRQDAPPLGRNQAGRISPIRPQFIAYYSDLREEGPPEIENRLVAAQWKAFFPHTIRSGTVMCDQCHDNRRRFLLEKDEERIYRTDLDGLGLNSFWQQAGQEVVNGTFVSPRRFAEFAEKNETYTKAYVEKWKSLVERVGASLKD